MTKFTMLAILLLAACSSANGYEVELDNSPLVLPITEELGWFKDKDEEQKGIFCFSIASLDFAWPTDSTQLRSTGFHGMVLAN